MIKSRYNDRNLPSELWSEEWRYRIFMSRKGENIYKRKDGRWEGRYVKGRKADAKIHYGYVYGKTYKEAKKKMIEAVEESKRSSQEQDVRTQGDMAFSSLAEKWMNEKKVFFKESTIVRYRNLMEWYLLPEFETCTVKELTYAKIHAFSTRLLLNGGCQKKGLSPKTVSDILSLFHNILQYAYSIGLITELGNIVVPVKQQKKQVRIFSLAEQKKLCGYLESSGGFTSLGVLLCLFTGIRVGEVCALTWRDISLTERTIFVHQTMQRIQTDEKNEKRTKVMITAPKSSCSIRLIPIPNEVFKKLEEARTLPEAFLLTGSNTKYMEPRTLQYQFKRILQKCGIDDANFHALRHTFATRCVEAGCDIKSLSEILGHANVNITLNRYVHPSMELKRENMQRLSEFCAVNLNGQYKIELTQDKG